MVVRRRVYKKLESLISKNNRSNIICIIKKKDMQINMLTFVEKFVAHVFFSFFLCGN